MSVGQHIVWTWGNTLCECGATHCVSVGQHIVWTWGNTHVEVLGSMLCSSVGQYIVWKCGATHSVEVWSNTKRLFE